MNWISTEQVFAIIPVLWADYSPNLEANSYAY